MAKIIKDTIHANGIDQIAAAHSRLKSRVCGGYLIKAYVLEQTGLQVSNLYIAQVKRECGIIERENYNKPKSEDSRQPQCPEEKRKAIMEALKHFGML